MPMIETQNIEYKESWRDEYLKWICGFANAQGGTIYIGIDDNGNVIGLNDSKKLMEDIPNKIINKLGIVVDVMVITGADPSGAIMLASHPIITIMTCLIKGALAGYLGAISYKLLKNKKLAIVIDAIITPVVNTLILYIALIIFFDTSFAAMIAAFMSINFIIELLINVIIAPGLLNLINRASNRY